MSDTSEKRAWRRYGGVGLSHDLVPFDPCFAERKLLRHVLARAWHDVTKPNPSDAKLASMDPMAAKYFLAEIVEDRAEAYQWIFSDLPADTPPDEGLTFLFVVDAVFTDPEWFIKRFRAATLRCYGRLESTYRKRFLEKS
jgi:hypothetical protein